jgi:5-hydroxyisourate hydrolase
VSEEPGRLTTHVLDTAAGKPAQGVRITVSRDGETLRDIVTNDDGRADGPLLAGAQFTPGVYELNFHVGDYFRSRGQGLDEPLFLDVVPVRFGISQAGQHYHVPLLISPFGYSTYRGS